MEANLLSDVHIADTTDTISLIQQLFEQQVLLHPTAPALQFQHDTLTYGELNTAAERLARRIVQQAPDSRFIGLSTTRGLESILGLLAILKAGKAYVPLDPAYPQERLQQYVVDAGLTHCIAQAEETLTFTDLGLAVLHSQHAAADVLVPLPEVSPEATAYVIYTSGSTGKPKGVCVAHRGVVNLVQWQARNSVATVGTRIMLFAPLTFDASIQEIFFAFYVGATLIIIDNDLRLDPKRLLDFVEAEAINRLDVPFVTLQYLTEAAVETQHFPACLQEVLTGGEQLKITPHIVQFFSALPHCAFYNQYGPTEASITATNLHLTGLPDYWPPVPSIGYPIDGVEIFILDENLQLLPDGQAGELCISGNCLAQGYLHQPALTQDKFVSFQHPQLGPRRIYRSGDLARYLPDGSLDYLGRIDTQIKIRGNRIELGEIEVVLHHQPGIKQAVVVALEDEHGQKMLAAYLVPSLQPVELLPIREALAQKLPDYMIPAAYGWLPELPKTPNGKVDRKALPQTDLRRLEAAVHTAPISSVEQLICDTWQQVLGIGPISRNDNFFYLGGNSLVAVKMMTLLEQQTGKRLSLSSLFEAPTVEKLAQLLETAHTVRRWKSLVPIQPHGSKTPLYIVHGMGLNVLIFTSLTKHLDPDQPVYGLQAQGLDGVTEPATSIEHIAAAYLEEIIQQNPTGPYALAGYSLGGIIVFEMARQLLQQHKTVSSLLILDGEAAEHIADQSVWQAVSTNLKIKLSKVQWVLGNFLTRPRQTAQYYKPLATWVIGRLLQYVRYQPNEAETAPPLHSARISTEQVMDAYALASSQYYMKPLLAHLTVFKAQERIHAIYDTRNYGWKPFALQGLRMVEVPGDHETMLQAPYSQNLAQLLQQELDQAEASLPILQHEADARMLQ